VRPLSIAARLYLVIGLSTIALITVIGAALVGSGEMVTAGHNLHDRGAVAIKETSRLSFLFEEQEQLVTRAPAEIDRDRIRKYRARFDDIGPELSDALSHFAPLADTLVKNSPARLAGLFRLFQAHAGTVFDFAEDFLQEKAIDAYDGPVSAAVAQIDEVMDELTRAAAAAADAEVAALSRAREKMIEKIAGASALGIVAFTGLGIYFARRLTRQLSRIIVEMKELSAGDLDSQLAAESDPDEFGAMARALEVFRHEMSASREMAAEARRSHEHLARAQRIAHMGSDVRNLCTDEAEWSVELYNIFGVSRENFVPTTANFLRLVHPDDRPTILAARDQIRTGTCPDPFEYRIIRPDARVRHIYRETELIRDGAGNTLFLTGTCHDITEIRGAQARERDLERQLMHSQKLEALGTLAGGVAHDLNNTLVPILALSKLALEELPEESPVRGDVEVIIQASERARDLVRQILAFSRKQDLVRQEVDFARITREALRMLRASVPATIEIVERICEVPALYGDAGELHQAVVNLVTNAAQAIGGAVGTITVSLSAVGENQIAEPMAEGPPVVRLAVADSGCGIDEATLDRVFEPFFTTKAVGEGTGLGLSVVHGIVTGHGGKISVRSTPGKGSEFILLLPALDRQCGAEKLKTAAA
jgi:PAS domain S-box-containing protein